MAKRRKLIKRVYERGRETTVIPSKRKRSLIKVLKKKTVKAKVSRILKKVKSVRRVVKKPVRAKKQTAAKKPVIVKKLIPVRKPVLIKKPALAKKPAPAKKPILVKKPAPAVKKVVLIEKRKSSGILNHQEASSKAGAITQAIKRSFYREETIELPAAYDRTRLALMVKGPYAIYAYWEIAKDAVSHLRKTFSDDEIRNSKMILRMYDITLIDFNGFNANRWFDIEVGYHINNWYINLWSDGVSYLGEIGLLFKNGKFHPLARSNYATTPRLTHSARTEQIWMKVEQASPAPSTEYATESGSKNIFYQSETSTRTETHSKHTAGGKKSAAKSDVQKKRRTIYITDEDIRQFYARLSPLLRDIITSKASLRPARPARMRGGKYAFMLEGDDNESYLNALARRHWKYFIRRMRTGASEENVLFGGASESLVSSDTLQRGASENIPLEEKIKQRKFFFEVNTELIVYGRTEPDAEVWLGEKKVSLRSDGTFSMRFALPDGKVPLEFTAISNDKLEERKINTYVDRDTDYCI